ncbi:MAG TPA: hypothetical protein VN660_01770 [Steroidobacteraceae bacterium]|nr:hypothetical protein [Steroidobacteraceae bacterium]
MAESKSTRRSPVKADFRIAPGVRSYAGVDGALNVVRVYWGPEWMNCGDAQALVYHGNAEALIAIGAATAEMLSRRPRGCRRKRIDSDGNPFDVVFYSRQSPDGPVQFCRLVRRGPRELLALLPGAEAALAIHEKRQASTDTPQDVGQGESRLSLSDAGDALVAHRMLADDQAEFPEAVQHQVEVLLRRFQREAKP